MPEYRQPWQSVGQAGERLGLGRWAAQNAVRAGIIPHLPIGADAKTYKIPLDAPGRLLATAYNGWAPEDRPVYTQEELEKLSAISIDDLARELGWKRSATYERVKTGRIPRIRIGERYCVPQDVAQRLHDYAYKCSTVLLELKVHLPTNSRDILAD